MKSNMLYIMGVFLMSDNLEKTLYSIKQNLGSSIDQFKLLEDFLLHMDNHISLLEAISQNSTTTLSRITIDKWICEINLNQEKNLEYQSLVEKMENLIIEGVSPDQLVVSFSPLAKVYSNIRDNKGRDEAGRPVFGIMGKQLCPETRNLILEYLCRDLFFSSWSEWVDRIDSQIEILQRLVSHFPGSHSFGTLPISLTMMINSLKSEASEQVKLNKVVDILTTDDSRGDIYHLDLLMVKQHLLPIPSYCPGEE